MGTPNNYAQQITSAINAGLAKLASPTKQATQLASDLCDFVKAASDTLGSSFTFNDFGQLLSGTGTGVFATFNTPLKNLQPQSSVYDGIIPMEISAILQPVNALLPSPITFPNGNPIMGLEDALKLMTIILTRFMIAIELDCRWKLNPNGPTFPSLPDNMVQNMLTRLGRLPYSDGLPGLINNISDQFASLKDPMNVSSAAGYMSNVFNVISDSFPEIKGGNGLWDFNFFATTFPKYMKSKYYFQPMGYIFYNTVFPGFSFDIPQLHLTNLEDLEAQNLLGLGNDPDAIYAGATSYSPGLEWVLISNEPPASASSNIMKAA